MKANSLWFSFISARFFLAKKKRYRFGIFALCFAYLTLWMMNALSMGVQENMTKRVFQRLDAYRFSLSKKIEDAQSHFGISKMQSPTFEEAYSLKEYVSSLEVDLDFSYLIPEKMKNAETSSFYRVQVIHHTPFYANDALTKTMINSLMLEKLKKEQVLLPFSLTYSLDIYTPKNNYYIHDTFEFVYEISSFEVIEEYDFQNTATIYLPYKSIKSYLKNHYLKRLSLDQGSVISYYDWLSDKALDSKERNASVWLFVDHLQDAYRLMTLFEHLSSSYVLSSPVKENYKVFQQMSILMKNVLILILWITFIILVTLIHYLSYTHLLKDQHEIGIFFALGAKEKEIEIVYQLLGMKMNIRGFLYTMILTIPFYLILKGLEKKVIKTSVFLFSAQPLLYFLFFVITQILYGIMIHLSFIRYQKQEVENLLKEED